MVLGGRADHRGAAYVDILDHLASAGPAGDGGGERVEVDDDEVDPADAVRRHRGGVLRIVADGEEAAMDLGVQRLHPPVHHLGETGQVGDVANLELRLAQG